MAQSKRFQKLAHSIYECKCHVVFCPEYRYQMLRGEIGVYVGQRVYKLCLAKERLEVLELNVQADHVHVVLSILPKHAVSEVMGYLYLKGKLALRLFARYKQLGKWYWGRHMWSRGYCVSTVG